jgi:hypothetical protein
LGLVQADLLHQNPRKHTIIGIFFDIFRFFTQQDFLPSLMGDGTNELNSVRRGKKYFEVGRLEQTRPNEPTKEGPLSFVVF